MFAPTTIACPLDFEVLVTPGYIDGLTAIELGALARLIRAAWRETPPCTLPGEDITLAMVARVTDEEWARIKPRLFLALAVTQTAPTTAHAVAGGSTGRIELGHTRRVFDTLSAQASAHAEQRRAAGRASAAARRGDPPPPPPFRPPDPPEGNGRSTAVQRPFNERSTGVQRALNERSTDVLRFSPAHSLNLKASAHSLERTIQKTEIERTERPYSRSTEARAQSDEPTGDVIAAINSDARSLLAHRLHDWRRRQARLIIESAIISWREAGHTMCPSSKAIELAGLPAALPARVDYLVSYANDLIASAKASKPAGRVPNPVGVLIDGLGASLKSKRRGPLDVPLIVSKRWEDAERDALRTMEVQASINTRLAALKNQSACQQGRVGSLGGGA